MIYIYSILLILLGAVLEYSNIKVDSSSFWVIVLIIIALFVLNDIMSTPDDPE